MKKNRVINMTLSEREEINTAGTEAIKRCIKINIKNIEDSLDILSDLEVEREILDISDKEQLEYQHIADNIFEKDFEILDEIVSFNSKIVPSNYFSLELYSKHSNLKNNILYGLCDFIKSSFKSNKWQDSICIFAIRNEVRLTDLDNYYCKPFLDGIVLSGLIVSDSYKKIRLIYTENKSNKSIINIKIINKNCIEKYKELIIKELI